MEEPVVPRPSPFRRLTAYLPKSPWQLAVVALFGVFAAGVVALALVAAILTPTLPAVDQVSDRQLKVPMRVYTAEGDLIAEFGEEKRIPLRIDEVPDTLIKAILAAEDHSFFYHHGVDYLGILRAAIANLRAKSASQGASTITMQVARNYFLSPEKTYTRKLKEILLAYKLERELSKKEILELYINKIFLGHRAYGFAAAAQIYYGKPLAELELPAMAMLAGLPKAPSRTNPISNPPGAMERRNYVLRHMHNLGYIDEPTLLAAVAAPETASKHNLRFAADAPHVAEMVRQYMIERYDEKTYADGFHVHTTLHTANQRAANRALRRRLLEYERRHGYRGAAGHMTIRTEPDRDRLDDALKDYRIVGDLVPGVVLKVETKSATIYTQDGDTVSLGWIGLMWARHYVDENTLGPVPKTAADILQRGDIVYLEHVDDPDIADEVEKDQEFVPYWRLAQVPQVSGALVSLRPSDGAILALSGGFDFYHSSFNRAVQAERQPGSGLKPFVYTAALAKGYTAASTVSGAPIVIEDATLEDEWRPEDYSHKFFGPTRLRKALTLSLNLVSVRLLRAIGATYTAEYLTRFGFDSDKLPRNLSLALGTASATPLQMARAYSVFANGGHLIEPYFIQRIEDANHQVLEQAGPLVACDDCSPKPVATETAVEAGAGPQPAPVAIPQDLAFIMTSIMRDVVREGTGRGAMALGRKDLAGKTGTTNDYRDAWFSGFNSSVVTTAWVGFDQPASLGRGETGGRAALPMWIDYMRVALDGVAEQPLTAPEDVVTARVNRETGLPSDENDIDSMEEYFVKGTETQTQGPLAEVAETPAGPGASSTRDKANEGSPDATPPPQPPPDNVRKQLF